VAARADFFISYATDDQLWAQWIATALEDEGYSAVLEEWSFGRAGTCRPS
jgi:hypothetical protein